MIDKLKKLVLFFTLLNFNLMAQNEQVITPDQNNQKKLRILSWNIYMLPYISLFNGNGKRAFAIAKELQNSDYQIIVFQEAFSSKCRNILAKNLIEKYPYQYGPANRNHTLFRTNSGLWIVSKFPLYPLDEIQFSLSRGYDAVARKGAVLFQGYYQGTPFQLLATHLQANSPDRIRLYQCAEIKEHLLNPYYLHNVPQLLCGDFNVDSSDDTCYREMLNTLDAKNGEISGDVQITYDEKENTLAKTKLGKQSVIDYILVRNDYFIDNIERKIQRFSTFVGNKRTNLSDHYAVEATLRFSKGARIVAQVE